jgi:hypothetical protein
MDKRRINALLAALVVTILGTLGLFFINPELVYLGLVLIVLILILLMSVAIMGETEGYPDIVCRLRQDAKGLILVNRGNSEARNIHIAVVPLNLEFDIPALAPDGEHEVALPSMVAEAKAVVNYENTKGGKYMRTYLLSALGSNEDDLLKPMFPMFSWKEKENK